MDKISVKLNDKFIEAVGTLGESFGLSRTVCQMYALLYISPEALSPASIAKLLGISKGNVSINMRKLEEWNAVKKVWRKGYVRSFYTANEDVENIVFEKIKTGLEKRNNFIRDSLSDIKKNLKASAKEEGNPKTIKHFKTRIKKFEGILQQTDSFVRNMDLFKSFLKK